MLAPPPQFPTGTSLPGMRADMQKGGEMRNQKGPSGDVWDREPCLWVSEAGGSATVQGGPAS